MLSINPAKKPLINDGDDEQAAITVANIKNCLKLEKETDRSFKALPKAPLCDKETLSHLKGILRFFIHQIDSFIHSRYNK